MKRMYILILLCIYTSTTVSAQNFNVRTVKNNLFIPWEIIFGPDSNIWFTQKNGYICRMDPVNGNTDTMYHETNTVIQTEGGMLGMALHPSFPIQPYVYVAYEYTSGGYKERIVRYTYFPGGDSLGSPLILLDNIIGASIHNGCRLLIVNDKLFIATGDAGQSSNSQNLTNNINGKILRINLDGSIPGDNPISGSPIWSWGHRNDQGLVYANGIMYTSMHGPTVSDEINIIVPGGNYGWPSVNGYCDQPSEMTFCTDSNVIEPIYEWTPTIAVSGMDFYDHPMFPQWQNALAMATLKDTSLYILRLNNTHDSIIQVIRIDTLGIGRIRDICISPAGSIFLSTSNSNSSGTGSKIDRIVELYDSTFVPVGAKTTTISNSLTIYPNPANDNVSLNIKGGTISGMIYVISNTMGQAVRKGIQQGNAISLKELPAGLYQLTLTGTKGEIYTGKILKE